MRWFLVYLTFAALVVCLFSGALCIGQFYNSVIWKHAVIIAEYSDSKFEPIDDATTFFTLREGESVTIGAQKQDWLKVKRLDGKQGWIKEKDLELL